MIKTFLSDDEQKYENKAETDSMGERAKALGFQVMENCRNELYSRFPYLDGAFAALSVSMGEEAGTIGTDGRKLYVSPSFLFSLYVKDPEKVRRGYLHILMHCLYLHFCPMDSDRVRGEEKRRKWNLACDMAVEWTLEEMMPSGKAISPEDSESVRNTCRMIFKCEKEKGGISAEQILGFLEKEKFPYPDAVLEKCFAFDSHALWETDRRSGMKEIRRKWEELLFLTVSKQGASRRRGSEKGNQKEEMDALKKGRYDYRKFLKRFAIMREEVELDMDSFDYIPYDMGMRMFGNLPFVEPLEYKEVHKLEELVIAIDTSSSCSRETVQQFLNETYSILNEKENFFRKFKVYIVQCDCFLQNVAVLHNEEEWKAYIKKVEIEGRSGTDFRPVFQYVEELRRKRELRDLKALIYFTDGDGIYPEKAVEYETAFVFLKRNEHMEKVPKWALRLVTD